MGSDDLLTSYFKRLEKARYRALLLDYDGTLAPFRVDREHAMPYPGVVEILQRILAAGHSRVVLITGRPTADLLPLLDLDPHPEIWGSHGWERLMPDGTYSLADLDRPADQTLTAAFRAMKAEGLADHCERKPAGLALHWRGLDPSSVEQFRAIAQERWAGPASRAGLVIREFDGGIEIRVPGRDKGIAVRVILSEMPQQVVTAYLGDDLTDEDAFKAIRGRGLGVLVRPERRPSAASLWLRPPEELIDFLVQWHENSESQQKHGRDPHADVSQPPGWRESSENGPGDG